MLGVLRKRRCAVARSPERQMSAHCACDAFVGSESRPIQVQVLYHLISLPMTDAICSYGTPHCARHLKPIRVDSAKKSKTMWWFFISTHFYESPLEFSRIWPKSTSSYFFYRKKTRHTNSISKGDTYHL